MKVIPPTPLAMVAMMFMSIKHQICLLCGLTLTMALKLLRTVFSSLQQTPDEYSRQTAVKPKHNHTLVTFNLSRFFFLLHCSLLLLAYIMNAVLQEIGVNKSSCDEDQRNRVEGCVATPVLDHSTKWTS